MPLTLTLFTREGCHLCDDALAVIERVRTARPFELLIRDLDRDVAPTDPRFARYTTEVPVIEIDGLKAFKFRVTEEALLRALDSRDATRPTP